MGQGARGAWRAAVGLAVAGLLCLSVAGCSAKVKGAGTSDLATLGSDIAVPGDSGSGNLDLAVSSVTAEPDDGAPGYDVVTSMSVTGADPQTYANISVILKMSSGESVNADLGSLTHGEGFAPNCDPQVTADIVVQCTYAFTGWKAVPGVKPVEVDVTAGPNRGVVGRWAAQ